MLIVYPIDETMAATTTSTPQVSLAIPFNLPYPKLVLSKVFSMNVLKYMLNNKNYTLSLLCVFGLFNVLSSLQFHVFHMTF